MAFVLWYNMATFRDLDKKRPASGSENGDDSDGDEEVSSLRLAPRHLHQMAGKSKAIKTIPTQDSKVVFGGATKKRIISG